MKNKEYHKRYYEQNKEKILEKNRLWRIEHREQLREQKRLYESSPERRAKKRAKSAREYLANREAVLARQAARRRERKEFTDQVCLHYGCRNPGCKWQCNFMPYQLDFHHFDRATKVKEVAKMESWAFERIIEEINKCIVLCKNCHALADRGEIKLSESLLCKVRPDLTIGDRR